MGQKGFKKNDFNNYREELERLIGLLDRVKSPNSRRIIAKRFEQVLSEIDQKIDQEEAA